MSGFTRIYADANATVPPLPEVIDAVVAVMKSDAGNPASAHGAGAEARRVVEAARDEISELLTGVLREDIVFVSGGTEANNTVLASHRDHQDATFLVAPVEHPSVLKPLAVPHREGRLRWLAVDSNGRVEPDSAADHARRAPAGQRIVLAIQAANGETGIVQPVADVVSAVRRERDDVFVLLDAAQAVGRLGLNLAALEVDAVGKAAPEDEVAAVLDLGDGVEA